MGGCGPKIDQDHFDLTLYVTSYGADYLDLVVSSDVSNSLMIKMQTKLIKEHRVLANSSA